MRKCIKEIKMYLYIPLRIFITFEKSQNSNISFSTSIFFYPKVFEFLKNGQKKCPILKNSKILPFLTISVTIKKIKVRLPKK